jgi:putative membrane protein
VRYVYMSLVVVVTAVVLLFKIQNFEAVTISLLGASVTLPTSVLIIGVYALGMVSGSALLGVLRGWVKGAMRQGQ